MAIGIKVSGRNNKVIGNKVTSDDIGIDVVGDANEVAGNRVFITTDKLKEICKQLNIPEAVPDDILLEAIHTLKEVNDLPKAPLILEHSRLKTWLQTNGFNMAFWVSTAISLAGMALTL